MLFVFHSKRYCLRESNWINIYLKNEQFILALRIIIYPNKLSLWWRPKVTALLSYHETWHRNVAETYSIRVCFVCIFDDHLWKVVIIRFVLSIPFVEILLETLSLHFLLVNNFTKPKQKWKMLYSPLWSYMVGQPRIVIGIHSFRAWIVNKSGEWILSDFPQAKLESKIYSFNEHDDLYFLSHNFGSQIIRLL